MRSQLRAYNRFRWLVPGKLAGAPHPDLDGGLLNVADFLRGEGIRTIVTVDEQPITPDPAELGFRYRFVRTPNYRPPKDLASLVSAIDREIESDQPVVVHCFAGIGRTGIVLAAWLLWNDRGLTAQQAIQRVTDEYLPDYARRRFPEHPSQVEALARFADSLPQA